MHQAKFFSHVGAKATVATDSTGHPCGQSFRLVDLRTAIGLYW